MDRRALAALFVVAIWWLSTGIVLGTVWLRRSTFRISLAVFTVAGAVALAGVFLSSRSATVGAAYAAFTCAVVAWGWHEVTFLLGVVTGPQREACPPGVTSWGRFRYATLAVIHHEVGLAGTLLLIAALSYGRPNQVATQTFFVLWAMRLSAKLNVYLGVPNLSEEFVPEHLRYLTSYFRRARMNVLMPFSVLVSTAVLIWLAIDLSRSPSAFSAVGGTLVLSILGLGVLEHLFLALPVPDALLWRWAMRKKQAPGLLVRDVSVEAP
jgi:putative photosynthetic complex assembly protein 2